MSNEVSEDFETGSDGTNITSSNTDFTSVNSTPKISTDWSVQGTRSMECATTAGAAPHGVYLWGSDQSLRWVSSYLRVDALPAANQVIRQWEDEAGNIVAQLRLLTNGTVQLRRRSGGSLVANYTSTAALAPDTDYRVPMKVNATGSVYRVKVYAGHSSTPLIDSGDVAYAAGAFRRLREGPTVNMADYVARYDALRIDTATEPAALASPPTVDAGDDATITTSGTASLDATVSGTTGTPSYAWTVVSGPSTSGSQFSAATSVDTDFTPAGGVGVYVCQLAVTDDSGVTTATCTVTVTAVTAEGTLASVTTATDWTATGAASVLLALQESDPGDLDRDSYVTTASNPSSLDLKVRLTGVTKPTGDFAVVLYDLARNGGSSGTFDLSLIRANGSTVVKKISGTTLPATPTDTTVTFAAADIASMPDEDWDTGDLGPYLLLEVTAS